MQGVTQHNESAWLGVAQHNEAAWLGVTQRRDMVLTCFRFLGRGSCWHLEFPGAGS